MVYLQSPVQLFYDPMDCSSPVSSIPGISQARILEWVAISSSWYLPDPGIKHTSPELQADSLPFEPLIQSAMVGHLGYFCFFPLNCK